MKSLKKFLYDPSKCVLRNIIFNVSILCVKFCTERHNENWENSVAAFLGKEKKIFRKTENSAHHTFLNLNTVTLRTPAHRTHDISSKCVTILSLSLSLDSGCALQ